MSRWIRVRHEGRIRIGTLEEGEVAVHEGDLFAAPHPTGERIPLEGSEVLTPCDPTKIIGLWNNFRAAAEKNGWSEPEEPLYFLKSASTAHPAGRPIRRPRSYAGRVFFEGELGVVIGRECRDVSAAEVEACVFGYTCINDVSAVQLIFEDSAFQQWSRGKSFDTFCPFGPVIATGLDPGALRIVARMGGRVRQDFPVSDMFFDPLELVRRISRDTTLFPGDLISCGTSLGALPMRNGAEVEIEIEGIGTLANTFLDDPAGAGPT